MGAHQDVRPFPPQSTAPKRVNVECTGSTLDEWSEDKKEESVSCLEDARRAVARLPSVTITSDAADELWRFTSRDVNHGSEAWPSVLTLGLIPHYRVHDITLHLAKFLPGAEKPFAAHAYSYHFTYVQQLLLLPVGICQLFGRGTDWDMRALLASPDYLKSPH